MRIIYFLGALGAGYLTVLRLPGVPTNVTFALEGNNAAMQNAGSGSICVTILCVSLTFVLLSKAFAPARRVS